MEEEVGRVDGVGVVRGGRCEICKMKLAKRRLERDAAKGETEEVRWQERRAKLMCQKGKAVRFGAAWAGDGCLRGWGRGRGKEGRAISRM